MRGWHSQLTRIRIALLERQAGLALGRLARDNSVMARSTLSPAILLACSLALPGCAAADIVGGPVRTAGKAIKIGSTVVDVATTSQSERDQKRGREIRKREERLGKLEREYLKEREDCLDGDRGACKDAEGIREEMEELLPTIPLDPD